MAGKLLSIKLPFGNVFDMFVVRPVVDGSVALNFAGSNFVVFAMICKVPAKKTPSAKFLSIV